MPLAVGRSLPYSGINRSVREDDFIHVSILLKLGIAVGESSIFFLKYGLNEHLILPFED